ncbi:MAG: STAS domain-containing protein [Anaerolineaceae bacterium]|nr:STAS domain-containing protein [Anaerolineaceae bacterium]
MDYRSLVNPTYLTAKSTLLMLAGAGNEDAKKMIAALGTQDDVSRNAQKNGSRQIISESELKALMAGSSLAVEARYAALSRFMKTEGYTNLLDIACGYTPRAVYCSTAGIDYVGLDVPVVAEELQAMAKKLGFVKDHPFYVSGDATNAASLMAAADLLKGKIVISCEGLSQYLSADEFEQFIGGIQKVLEQHGGVWVTSDMGVDYEAFASAAMSSPDAKEVYNKARINAMKSSNIYGDGVALWSSEKKQEFIEAHGFKVERIPFYHGDEGLNLLTGIPDVWRAAFIRLLEESRLWKMTLTENVSADKIEGAKQVDNLKIDYEKRSGQLLCRVTGRIDTISAPALLEVFENNYEGISAVRVDAKDMEYISSAGLRVLLMAVKKTGNVSVVNASEAVKEIFETTGFDQMVKVE